VGRGYGPQDQEQQGGKRRASLLINDGGRWGVAVGDRVGTTGLGSGVAVAVGKGGEGEGVSGGGEVGPAGPQAARSRPREKARMSMPGRQSCAFIGILPSFFSSEIDLSSCYTPSPPFARRPAYSWAI
jgi:hypothetical protein